MQDEKTQILSEEALVSIEDLNCDAKLMVNAMSALRAMNKWGNKQYERGLKDGYALKAKPIGHDYTKL